MGNRLSKTNNAKMIEKFQRTTNDLNTVFEGYITKYTGHILIPDEDVDSQKINVFECAVNEELIIVKVNILKSITEQIKKLQEKYHHSILDFSEFANVVAINYNKASIESKAICENIEAQVKFMMEIFNLEQKKYHKFNKVYHLDTFRETRHVYIKELGDTTFYQSNNNIYLEILRSFIKFLRENLYRSSNRAAP